MRARRAAVVAIAVLAVLAGGGYLFLERPWSEYSLLAMNSLFDADERVENFRNMDEIFPSESIAPAPSPVEPPRDERPLRANYRFGGERRSLDGFLRRTVTTGLLVLQDGEVVDERYLHGATPASRFTSWSVAKSFVSTLVGIALADGRIESLDDPLGDYVPALEDSAYDGAAIRDVLRMSSGVDFDEDYDARLSDINVFFVKLFALGRDADDLTAGYGRARPPGEAFDYASVDTQALAMLLREIYDRPLTELLEQRLWHPLGARAAHWSVDDTGGDGTAIAFCCLNARLRDFAKLGQLYAQRGRWRGRRLLPASWVREATTPGAPYLEPGALPGDSDYRGYAYHWWVPEGYEREYFAAGVWGQYVYVSEPDRVVIARTAVDPDWREHGEESIAAFRAIRDALRGGPSGRQRTSRPQRRDRAHHHPVRAGVRRAVGDDRH